MLRFSEYMYYNGDDNQICAVRIVNHRYKINVHPSTVRDDP